MNMKIYDHGDTLRISELTELAATNSDAFRKDVRAAFPATLKTIEIDLSQTGFVDSCGLGALIAIHKLAVRHNGKVTIRLLNPAPPIQQIFELTRLHRIFEIVNS